jgi:GNAT superfamily N-acetyltransferase
MSPPIDLMLVRKLEEKAFRAWPALETHSAHGWIQRLSGGYTKRANSINALSPESDLTVEMKDKLEVPYRQRGVSAVWRLSPLAPPGTDALLAQSGYRSIDRSLVQRAPLDERHRRDSEVKIDGAPSPAWLAGFAELSPVAPSHRETMTRMLTSIAAPVGFAHVDDDGQPIAFALGVVDGDHVGLFDVLVSPSARRRGLARRITQTIGAWGRENGAKYMYLQVVAANTAALPLYAALGFETVYSYAYRVS